MKEVVNTVKNWEPRWYSHVERLDVERLWYLKETG